MKTVEWYRQADQVSTSPLRHTPTLRMLRPGHGIDSRASTPANPLCTVNL